jgi:hypothetical protein
MAQGTVNIDQESLSNRHLAETAAIARSKLAQRVLAVTSVSPTDWRTWDALGTNLPGTPANDDLGIVTGTWGTDLPYIGTGDVKTTSSTRRAAGFFVLPSDYEAAETVTIRAYAGMKTTVADGSCTLDFELWRVDKEDGTLGAGDLVATAATSINSLTADDKDFTVTATTLLPGDVLYVRMSVAYVDAATGTAVIGAVYQVELLSDCR